MKPSRPPRTPSRLSASLRNHLNMYSLAGTAAGVGVLALAQAADAEVIYTPAHVPFSGVRTQYRLDLNNDGRSDFTLQLSNTSLGAKFFAVNEINGGKTSNAFVVAPRDNTMPLALKAGTPIGSGAHFFGSIYSYEIMAYATQKHGGDWVNVSDRYLGLKFVAEGNVYYGWARLSVQLKGRVLSAVLSGYAYENVPGQGIRAGQISGTADNPEFATESAPQQTSGHASTPQNQPTQQPISQDFKPATLGMLALGAPGIQFRRREESVAGLSESN
jgi:hypothetical protein